MARKNGFGLLLSMVLLLTGCRVQLQGPPAPTPATAAPQAYSSPVLPAATISAYPPPGDLRAYSSPVLPAATISAYPAPTTTPPPAAYKSSISASYVPLAGVVNQKILDYFFLDDLHGWVSTDTSLLATNDGGQTWQERFAIEQVPIWAAAKVFYPIDFISFEEGFAAQGTSLLHTIDGGKTWQSLPDLDPPDFMYRMDFVDRLNIWAATPQHGLLRSQDGGISWQPLKSPCTKWNNNEQLRIDFVDANAGWAVCHQDGSSDEKVNALYVTTDGGNHWEKLAEAPSDVTQPSTPNALTGWLPELAYDNAPSFSDRDHGWITGNDGHLYTTDDGGHSWLQVPSKNFDTLFYHPQQISPKNGYILANGWTATDPGALLKTVDGGETWQQILPKFYPHQTSYLDARNGFGVGGVGGANIVFRTDDGGYTWNEAGALPTHVSNSMQVQFVDTLHGWDISQDCPNTANQEDCGNIALYHTDDGGQTWDRLWSRKINNSIRGVFFVSPSEGYLVSDGGRELYFSQDGGKTLTQIQSLQGTNNGVEQAPYQFLNFMTGYVISRGQLYITRDGARTWQAMDTGCQVYIISLGRDGSMWIACSDGIRSSIDGGLTWQPIVMPGMDIKEIQFVDSKHGWLRGGTQTRYQGGYTFGVDHIYITVDGGATWTQLN
jgi:photosystem II stability/assembly factor-like uncharacterized protein